MIFIQCHCDHLALSGGSEGKESACNVEEQGSIPGSGRSSGAGNGKPLQYSCLENSTARGAWWSCRIGHDWATEFQHDHWVCFQLSAIMNNTIWMFLCVSFGAHRKAFCYGICLKLNCWATGYMNFLTLLENVDESHISVCKCCCCPSSLPTRGTVLLYIFCQSSERKGHLSVVSICISLISNKATAFSYFLDSVFPSLNVYSAFAY